MKKFELTTNTKVLFGKKLFQIKALVSFGDVEAGELGGFVEKEENVSQDGNAWVSGNAQVSGDAQVYGNAQVSGNAWVYGNARVSGNAQVCGNARVYGNAWVSGNAQVSGNAWVVWFSKVGSENGTLTAYPGKDGKILISRGCFFGDIDQFESAVNRTHGDNSVAQEYKLLIQFIRMRFANIGA